MKEYSKEECIEALKEANDQVDGSITVPQYRELDIRPSFSTISQRFRTWNKAKEKAGLDKNSGRSEELTKECCIESIKKFYKKNENPSHNKYIESDTDVSEKGIQMVFDNWSEAIEAAGIQPWEAERKHTDQDCVDALRKADQIVDGVLTQHDYKELGFNPGITTLQMRFGDWNSAKQEAGINVVECTRTRTPSINMQNGYEFIGTTAVHRLLAVAIYGIDEVEGMDVHHKNGIRWDNRPENIEILSSSEHSRLHAKQMKNDPKIDF